MADLIYSYTDINDDMSDNNSETVVTTRTTIHDATGETVDTAITLLEQMGFDVTRITLTVKESKE